MNRFDLICIGCGPAGERAATQAAALGKRVGVVEREPRPGGAMVNTGTIASKALRETALLCSAFRRRPLPGMELEFQRDVSITRFMSRRHLVQQQEHDRIEAALDRSGIEVFRGSASFLDASTIEIRSDGHEPLTISAEHILVAVGTHPVRPAHIPFGDSIVDSDTLLDLPRMPRSMVVMGAGVIGSEYACLFAEMGVNVTLVEPRSTLLPFVDADCRAHLMRAMRDQGIQIRFDSTITAAARNADGTVQVSFDNNDEITTDVLAWTSGRQGNTASLQLDRAGLSANERGLITVNENYQTAVPSIYAAGDVIGFPALASTSMEQGRVAACHMFGAPCRSRLSQTVPIGLYTIPAVSMVGLSEDQARKQNLNILVGRASYRFNARGRMLGDEEGLLKCVFDADSRQLLGCTIVGEQATELIHLAQSAIVHDAGIDYFIEACLNYPSLTELYKVAAVDALASLADSHPRAQAA